MKWLEAKNETWRNLPTRKHNPDYSLACEF